MKRLFVILALSLAWPSLWSQDKVFYPSDSIQKVFYSAKTLNKKRFNASVVIGKSAIGPGLWLWDLFAYTDTYGWSSLEFHSAKVRSAPQFFGELGYWLSPRFSLGVRGGKSYSVKVSELDGYMQHDFQYSSYSIGIFGNWLEKTHAGTFYGGPECHFFDVNYQYPHVEKRLSMLGLTGGCKLFLLNRPSSSLSFFLEYRLILGGLPEYYNDRDIFPGHFLTGLSWGLKI